MFSMLYFPVVSALAASDEDAGSGIAARAVDSILDGEFAAAVQQSGRRLDDSAAAATAADLQWHADLQLVLGFDAEAEDAYRRAQRRMRGSKAEIRVATCRNAAWQALFRHRIGTALACFARAAEEVDAPPARRIEARIGIACALHELGRTREALDALDEVVPTNARWRELVIALRFDLIAQHELRCANALQDHVYWRSAALASPAAYLPAPRVGFAEALQAAAGVRAPLLAARVAYLRELRNVTSGERDAIANVCAYLERIREQGFADYQRAVRLEIALASFVGDAPHVAQTIIEPLHQGVRGSDTGHRQLEYLYCAAKLRESQGRAQESLQWYSRYALVAMQCLREDSHVRTPALDRQPKAAPDDVSARLPAKYRRAYRYVLDNLDRADLSVREIATQIGVTERALQSAFKSCLGLSPSELIRTRRMERIREALIDHADAGDQRVLETARRWGVQSRSTLVTGYRKQFREAPSETLER
ncbi:MULTISPECIES: helix-turn-helix transcriptional regulator [Burkholderia]|uniref:helix-turn-helix transcriptional regulator n=1 Tax=Burkholderia TaxID=32008 RepID=UPI000BBD4197|nr:MULTISPECIES: helix-turn-helix transcriptional regulator [Burkholderia]ATF90345.1 AraC family transcriptional regulator [Burkholderia gladioli pv. gladioli]MBJ9665308.1 helix-turn-helix transcriptional regulator [Burkholderia gladioli]MBJ9710585.1 helix-turn-helix transcriptional regulator [Burkholderia gladioli]MBU9159630.1 helix-turn-helix transcriptional regulator [Burkholderia gladioli]MBU9171910.1 helix-turn-helix transcriptional regulator [Burkholderia gladioli]